MVSLSVRKLTQFNNGLLLLIMEFSGTVDNGPRTGDLMFQILEECSLVLLLPIFF